MKRNHFKKLGRLLVTISTIACAFFLLLFILFSPISTSQEAPYISVFQEVWQTVNDNFYDPQFNGVDWQAIQKKHEPLVKQTKSIDEAAVVINQMLSELNTSHTRFYTQTEPAYYQLLGIFNQGSFAEAIAKLFPNGNFNYTHIGIFTKNIDGKTFITGILDNTPAAQVGLQVGDQILAVDGQPYQPIASFAGKADQEVELSIQPTPDPNSIKKITIIPRKINPNTVLLDAMDNSIEIIEQEQLKLGYIHIWSYAGEQYQELLEDEIAYGRLKQADGLILDLRDGWGGATPNYLNIFTDKVPILTMVERDGRPRTIDYQWRKPVVMIVNEGTRSGKEILAYGFKQYGIGKTVGTKTAGAVLAGRPFLMQDGNLLYLAVADVFVNGERLEGKGVIPDIEVPFQVEYAGGSDPQKDKAIEVLVR